MPYLFGIDSQTDFLNSDLKNQKFLKKPATHAVNIYITNLHFLCAL